MAETFNDWSADWNRLKSSKGTPFDIEATLAQWSMPPPATMQGIPCPPITGSRKNYKSPRGRQKIEALLFGEKGRPPRPRKIYDSIISNLGAYAIFNNFSGTKIGSGNEDQMMADAFGILRVGKSYHPLSIEVKVADSNCWSAVVQNLQQVRFFSSMGRNIQRALAERGSNFVPQGTELSDAWGIVIAPPDYWSKVRRLNEALHLLAKLTETIANGCSLTNAHILLAAIDDSGIRLVAAQKLSKSGSV
jgi:hypothetical protein